MARQRGFFDGLDPSVKRGLAAGAGALGAYWIGRQFPAESVGRVTPAVLGAAAGYAVERAKILPGLGYGVALGGIGASIAGPPAPRVGVGQRGVALTLWHSDGLDAAWAAQRETVLAVRPEIVLLHFGGIGTDAAASSVTRQVREALGADQRVWVQVYADGAVENGPDALVRFAGAVQRAIRAEAVVWDGERGFRVAAGAQAWQRLYAATRRELPGVPMGHTSYSNPNVHRDSFPWAAALGGGDFAEYPDFVLAQMYPFGDERREGMIEGATMDALAAGAWGGWRAARLDGRLNPRTQVGAYFPGAHVPAEALVRAAEPTTLVAFWPWHGRYDTAGMEAARTLAARLR